MRNQKKRSSSEKSISQILDVTKLNFNMPIERKNSVVKIDNKYMKYYYNIYLTILFNLQISQYIL